MVNIHNLGETNSVLNTWLKELRHIEIQKDRMRFRKNIQRIGQVIGYEISKLLEYENQIVQTPLGNALISVLNYQPVIGCVFRAGLPLYEGLLDFFDGADSLFIGSYRKHDKSGHFEIHQEYLTSPSIDNRDLIIADTMIASGASIVEAFNEVLNTGKPKSIHLVGVIASKTGIDYIVTKFPEVQIWVAAIDESLTENSYIVPGLGDAGDLAFGSKAQF